MSNQKSIHQSSLNSKGLYAVYLLCCQNRSIYCGITKDLTKRIIDHNIGKGSKYVKSHLPVKLLGATLYKFTRSEALKIEHKIKQVSHKDKLVMLAQYM